MKELNYFNILSITLLIVLVLLYFSSSDLSKTGSALEGLPDLSITQVTFSLDKVHELMVYEVSMANTGSTAHNFNYGYKDESGYFVVAGSYPLIENGQAMTFIIHRPLGQYLHEFKVDIGRMDKGETMGYLEEAREDNNGYIL